MSWNDFMRMKLGHIGSYEIIAGRVLMALVVFLVTWTLVKIIRRMLLRSGFITDKIDSKRRMSVFLIMKYAIWVVSIFLTLKALGFDITILLFGSTAVLVGLGFGLQNIFKDLISGLFLLFEGTIKIGDIIEADNVIGKVVEINLRSTEVLTRDDVTFIIPNSRFVSEKVVNWSHNNELVRFKVSVGVAYGSDVEKVFLCLEQAMVENSNILKKPKPFVRFTNFGDSALEFELIFWSKETFRIENVKSDLRRKVYAKLSENGLTIPFPQRDIHIKGFEKFKEFQQKEEQL